MRIPDATTAMRRILTGDVCYIDANHVTDDARLDVFSVNELSWGMVGDAAVMAEKLRWVGTVRPTLCIQCVSQTCVECMFVALIACLVLVL